MTLFTRYSKTLLVLAVALYATLVVVGNVTDYNSNFQFVSHVLEMDTVFPDNPNTWRAIHTPALHHAAYIAIILVETAVAALTLGMLLWFTGFTTVGGEWFSMWQSEIWNGQQAAFRLTVILGMVLTYLTLPDTESPTPPDR